MWKNNQPELDTASYSGAMGELLEAVISRCAEIRNLQVTGFDILYCLLTMRTDTAAFLAMPEEKRNEYANTALLLRSHLAQGITAENCIEIFETISESAETEPNPFLRECWLPGLADVVDALGFNASIHELLYQMFLRADDVFPGEAALIGRLFTPVGAPPVHTDVVQPDGNMNENAFSRRFWYLLERGLELTSDSGQTVATVLHVLYSAVGLRESYTNMVLGKVGISCSESRYDTAFQAFLYRSAKGPKIALNKDSFSKSALDTLLRSMDIAVSIGRDCIGEREFILSILQSNDLSTLSFLEKTLNWPLKPLREMAYQTPEPDTISPALPTFICESVFLDDAAEKRYVPRKDIHDQIIKNFLRRDYHNVILCGESGTGRTGMAYSLAQTLRENEYKSLQFMPMIYIDLGLLPEQKYMMRVEELLDFMDENSRRIYVLDGFFRYFKSNIHACKQRLTHNKYKLVIVMDPQEMTELRNPKEPSDLPIITQFLQENVNIVEIEEPSREETLKIIDSELPLIEKQFDVTISKDIGSAVYRMATDYLLSQRFPKKAIDLLARTAADMAAEAELRGLSQPKMDKQHVAARLSAITALPEETILGIGQEKDYLSILSSSVVGQDAAIAKVADRLDLIQKGLVEKQPPAAIFIFAGLSGTGKTELAKQIAQVYSNSRKLITYAMADFPEAHSVSGLIGSPAGYIGYEEGGKLIKDLNRDPYSVVLLDEVEKAHPAIWDPFLNLFDEGIIADRRGVTAYGNKAFFVLTSNIGQYEIADMLTRNAPMSQIEEVVKHEFANAKFSQAGGGASQKCFRPEFLGRIMPRGGIVVFNALSQEALEGIARHKIATIAKNHTATHEGSRLMVDDDVVEMIAKIAWERNEKAIRARDAYVGGRNLGELLDMYVNKKISADIRKIAAAPLVRIVLDGNDTALLPVYSDADANAFLRQQHDALLNRVAQRFDRIATVDSNVFDSMNDMKLTRLDAMLSEIGTTIGGGF